MYINFHINMFNGGCATVIQKWGERAILYGKLSSLGDRLR
jgi:hypothetical protein